MERMRKVFGVTTLAMIMMLVFLSIPGQAVADGYQNTAKTINSLMSGLKKRGDYVKYFCDGGENGPFRDITGGGSFYDRSMAMYGQQFVERYPGSQINCYTMSGTWVDGPSTFFIRNASVYKSTYVGDAGLTYEYDLSSKQKGVYVRISDGQGNNIAILVDLTYPSSSMYMEAKLPMTMQTNGSISGTVGYQYSADELVQVMNKEFERLKVLPNATLMAYANSLLLDRNERLMLLQDAKKMLERHKENTKRESKGRELVLPSPKDTLQIPSNVQDK